ncbi:DUF2599 domain-containing protein [Corynebacterium epidermidicanis]|uniref:DUF2599 domain-containing protein n=1 Tax=Corynebacterium epidermidicanis TaxID=1050174 RepID=UPI00130DAA25|nr:DUF2599 domain-containing protein [Corynebacterium epidermidicanis]
MADAQESHEVTPEQIADLIGVDYRPQIHEEDRASTRSADASDDRNVKLRTTAGDIELSIPKGTQNASKTATGIGDRSVMFDQGDDTVATVTAYPDESMQMHSVILSPTAPHEFRYDVSLPAEVSMSKNEDGGIDFVDSKQNFVAGIAPAWARDAEGNRVSSEYDVVGDSIVQKVATVSADQYPVVADPFLGKHLFNNLWQGEWNGDATFNGTVSPWGAVVMTGGGGVGGYVAGQAIMRDAGWKEWEAAFPDINSKASVRQQYECHILAGTLGLPYTGEYNLERARPDKGDWALTPHQHHCNWE